MHQLVEQLSAEVIHHELPDEVEAVASDSREDCENDCKCQQLQRMVEQTLLVFDVVDHLTAEVRQHHHTEC